MELWYYVVYLWHKVSNMAKENVKLETALVNKVRANKKKTGVPIGVFIGQAINEKLQRQLADKK